jgi:MFS family permease
MHTRVHAEEVEAEARITWRPMVVIGLAQILMVFNVSTLQVSIEGIASSFGAPATSVGTAIVVYSLVVAGLIMLGARVAEVLGARVVFRATLVLFGVAMAVMAASPGAFTMIFAQTLAGIAAAALVPSLVVLIADNYSGAAKARALGWLGGAQAIGIVMAFLLAGLLATVLSWRATFALLVVLAAVIFKLSDGLRLIAGKPGMRVDLVGVLLVAAGTFAISIGCNSLVEWGVLLATPAAPFSILDMSPAPFMIVAGVFLLQAFTSWSRRRMAKGETPLVALQVLDALHERAALFCMFTVGALGSAITFLVPLYIQIVQGRSSLQTAAAIVPFSLGSCVAAVLVVRPPGHGQRANHRPRVVHGDGRGAGAAGCRGPQRLEHVRGDRGNGGRRAWGGGAHHAAVQRADHRVSARARRRCGLPARDHQ